MSLSDDPKYHDACMPESSAQVSENLRDTISALRAEVAKYRGMEVENAGLRNDIEALKAELAQYTRPLTDEQIDRIGVLCSHLPMYGNEYDWWDMRDAAIREVRGK